MKRLLLTAVLTCCAWSHGFVLPQQYVTSATNILAAAAAYTPPTNLSVAPPMTVGSAFGASMIAGIANLADNPTIPLNDSRIALTGPVRMITPGNIANGFVGAWTSQGTLQAGGDGWGARFVTNSRYIEVSSAFDNTGTAALVRLRVDGQWAQTADYTLFAVADFLPHYALFDLGSSATRTVEVFFGGAAAPLGFNVSVGATLSVPSTPAGNTTAAYWGDSYVAGNFPGLANIRSTMAQALGQSMGVLNIVPEGVGGQGWVTIVNGSTIGGRMATDTGYIPVPNVVYAMASINDRAQATATITANITTGLRAVQAAYPDAWVVFFTGFTASGAPVDAAHFAAALAGGNSVNDFRTLVIDTSAYPGIATTGLLPNGQAHDSADGLHPGPNEVAYLTGLMKAAVVAALHAKARI